MRQRSWSAKTCRTGQAGGTYGRTENECLTVCTSANAGKCTIEKSCGVINNDADTRLDCGERRRCVHVSFLQLELTNCPQQIISLLAQSSASVPGVRPTKLWRLQLKQLGLRLLGNHVPNALLWPSIHLRCCSSLGLPYGQWDTGSRDNFSGARFNDVVPQQL